MSICETLSRVGEIIGFFITQQSSLSATLLIGPIPDVYNFQIVPTSSRELSHTSFEGAVGTQISYDDRLVVRNSRQQPKLTDPTLGSNYKPF